MPGRKPVIRAVPREHNGTQCLTCAAFGKCIDWKKPGFPIMTPTCCKNHDGAHMQVIFVEVRRE